MIAQEAVQSPEVSEVPVSAAPAAPVSAGPNKTVVIATAAVASVAILSVSGYMASKRFSSAAKDLTSLFSDEADASANALDGL